MGKGILPAIRDFLAIPTRINRAGPRQARASHYDIARTNPDNARQWEYADTFDSDRANSPAERQTARNRSRHETDNNPNLKGIDENRREYEVGHGPTLHVITKTHSILCRLERDSPPGGDAKPELCRPPVDDESIAASRTARSSPVWVATSD